MTYNICAGPSSVLWYSADQPGPIQVLHGPGGVDSTGECSSQELCVLTGRAAPIPHCRGWGEPQVLRFSKLVAYNYTTFFQDGGACEKKPWISI